MTTTHTAIIWTLLAAWCFLFTSISVSATTSDPVMWILVHHALKTARIDPIISPGTLSSHVHSLVGANGVSSTTTTADQLDSASTCTTSGLLADMSAYWAPTLYSFNANNDTFSPRPLGYVNTYYLMRGNVNITAFPRGLQLLGGNAMRQGPGPTVQADNTASFVCLNYANGSTQHETLPPGPCPQGLRTQIIFPSCWNGLNLTSPNHTHVVYPTGQFADNGPCPSTHNIRLPTLFYEFVWGVDGQDNTGNSTWVFSNGDAEGYSFHGDFIAAWDEEVLQGAIDECQGNLFNDLEACPPLARTLDRAKSQTCNTTSTEATSGSIAYLPGCNVVWNGPHAGKGLAPGCDPNKVMIKPPNWPPSNTSTATSSSTTSAATSSSTTATTSTAAPTSASTSTSAPESTSTSTSGTGVLAGLLGAPKGVVGTPKQVVHKKPSPPPHPPVRKPKKSKHPVHIESIPKEVHHKEVHKEKKRPASARKHLEEIRHHQRDHRQH